MKINCRKNVGIMVGGIVLLSIIFMMPPLSDRAIAGSYNGQDLALAILANQSTLISSTYTDTDNLGHRQGIVLSSFGTMSPTNGSTFALLSTGIAGTPIVTTGATSPGDERGSWFAAGKYGTPRDEATLTMTLRVPPFMHYLYYDVQFLSVEYPEYIGSPYNDKFTVTVDSPSQGITTYMIDVNSGNFVLNSSYIAGTGFDIFARNQNPSGPSWVDRTPRPGADGGATALVTHGGQFHPVSPDEQITVKFDIIDTGDNQFDSAAFIDNLVFSGYPKPSITAKKSVQDLNGEPVECGDTLKYTIYIKNDNIASQSNNPGNEFEDIIPVNATYVPGSATIEHGDGTIEYSGGKIIWNGNIPGRYTVLLTFEVTVDQGLKNGTIISNQGTVYWDQNQDGINEVTNLTDDISALLPGDHDPTNVKVIVFEPPSQVTEDFSDDNDGERATQSYCGRDWFETSQGATESVFEVAPGRIGAPGYKYLTDNSFKTKIRSSSGPLYWNYTLSELDSDIKWWEVWFTCGNASESADIYLDFKNTNGNDIAKIKFDYVHAGTNLPMDWVLALYYWSPITGWTRLNSDYSGGYLFNSWYKLKIEKNGLNYVNYSLYRNHKGLVDFKVDEKLSAPFSNFARVRWSSTKNPVVCPMFFWDEHTVGLVN